jgi:hypothetical protein
LVATAREVRLFGGIAGELDGPVVRRPRFVAPPRPSQKVRACGVVGVIAIEGLAESVDLGERHVWAVQFADRDRAIESDDR